MWMGFFFQQCTFTEWLTTIFFFYTIEQSIKLRTFQWAVHCLNHWATTPLRRNILNVWENASSCDTSEKSILTFVGEIWHWNIHIFLHFLQLAASCSCQFVSELSREIVMSIQFIYIHLAKRSLTKCDKIKLVDKKKKKDQTDASLKRAVRSQMCHLTSFVNFFVVN